jgi:hypothetical protein
VTIRNVGQAAANIESVSALGSFSVAQGCGTLPPGASCSIEITFLAWLPGSQQGTVEIRSNAEGSPHRIGLSGVGCFIPTPSRTRLGSLLCGP